MMEMFYAFTAEYSNQYLHMAIEILNFLFHFN